MGWRAASQTSARTEGPGSASGMLFAGAAVPAACVHAGSERCPLAAERSTVRDAPIAGSAAFAGS
jgi:hypothetical protein